MKKFILASLILIVMFSFVSVEVRAQEYRLTLPSPIEVGTLESQIGTLQGAQEGDVVYILTDSVGGSAYEMSKMVQAMLTTKAKTVCHIEQFSASAAAIISSSCDSLSMNSRAVILFHLPTAHYSLLGLFAVEDKITTNDWCPAYADEAQMFANYMESLGIRSMMTEAQWQEMLIGKDIILTPKDIAKNLGVN